MKKVILVILILIGAIFLFFKLGYCEEQTCVFKCDKEEIPKLIVSKVGKIEAEPDKAIMKIRVLIEEVKLEKAFEQNKEKMNQIIDFFKQEGVDKKDIKTIEYNITPLYEGKPLFSKVHKPTSYIVTYAISANIYKLDKIGDILNKISQIDSARVYGIEFTSTKLEELQKEALKKAAKLAKEAAITAVEAAGGKLGKILKLEVVGPGLEQMRRVTFYEDSARPILAKQAEAPPLSIEAGTLEIESTCVITYEIKE